jgi:phytoene synthase
VYTFCRYADNLVDVGEKDAASPDAGVRLAALRRELAELYQRSSSPTRWIALADTIQRYAIPLRYFEELIDGVEMDLTPETFQTFADLHRYCYRVASVVGLMMTHVFGATSEEALRDAAHLGTAMQLTNILRDIGEDYRMGRLYLPREDMIRYGVTEGDIAAGIVTDGVRRLLQFQIARARDYYRMADPGIALIPDDGSRFCVRLMSTLYAGILDAIERNAYDVFSRRALVPFHSKCGVALSIAMRRPDRPVQREFASRRSPAMPEDSPPQVPTTVNSPSGKHIFS